MTLVAVASTVTAATFITLGILGFSSIMSVIAAGLIVIIIVVCLIGAAKITKAVGNGNETGLRVAKLTRQVAGAMIVNTLIQGCYAIIGNGNDFMPLQIVVANLLTPVGASAALLLLLRFIRGSFERQGQRRKGARERGTPRATASVSPATNYTEKSSTRTGAPATGSSAA